MEEKEKINYLNRFRLGKTGKITDGSEIDL
jgi:hypothetical protein